MATCIAPSVDVSEEVVLGEGTSIWHPAQAHEHTVLGRDCIVGRGAYIGEGVAMGDNCKVQNYALMYESARLADGVFAGLAVALANDYFPRAVNPDDSFKSAADWESVGVTIEQGAPIGVCVACMAPVCIGVWAMVAAGAVITEDVLAHVLVTGIPTHRIGWVECTGESLAPFDPGPDGAPRRRCLVTGTLYEQFDVRPAAGSGSQSSSESTTIREVTHRCHAGLFQQPS